MLQNTEKYENCHKKSTSALGPDAVEHRKGTRITTKNKHRRIWPAKKAKKVRVLFWKNSVQSRASQNTEKYENYHEKSTSQKFQSQKSTRITRRNPFLTLSRASQNAEKYEHYHAKWTSKKLKSQKLRRFTCKTRRRPPEPSRNYENSHTKRTWKHETTKIATDSVRHLSATSICHPGLLLVPLEPQVLTTLFGAICIYIYIFMFLHFESSCVLRKHTSCTSKVRSCILNFEITFSYFEGIHVYFESILLSFESLLLKFVLWSIIFVLWNCTFVLWKYTFVIWMFAYVLWSFIQYFKFWHHLLVAPFQNKVNGVFCFPLRFGLDWWTLGSWSCQAPKKAHIVLARPWPNLLTLSCVIVGAKCSPNLVAFLLVLCRFLSESSLWAHLPSPQPRICLPSSPLSFYLRPWPSSKAAL